MNLYIQYTHPVKCHHSSNKVLIFNGNDYKITYVLAAIYYIKSNNLQIV